MLGTILGGVWTIGWVSIAFSIFMFSGLVWVLIDIPTQYQVNKLFAVLAKGEAIPPKLKRLLWMRMGVNALGVFPLLLIFFLMIHKPDVPKVGTWLRHLKVAIR